MAALRELFRPEFLNRIDDIVMFSPLGEDQIERIIDLQMQRVVKQLAERQMTLQLTPAAKALLFREGYDPAYGARPMKRAIQRLIQDPLAMKILDGEVQPGDDSRWWTPTPSTGEMKFSTAKLRRRAPPDSAPGENDHENIQDGILTDGADAAASFRRRGFRRPQRPELGADFRRAHERHGLFLLGQDRPDVQRRAAHQPRADRRASTR